MKRSLNPYREMPMVSLPNVKQRKLNEDDISVFISLAENNSLLLHDSQEEKPGEAEKLDERIVNMLYCTGYNNECNSFYPGIFIRKSYSLENFPGGDILAMDRYIVIASNLQWFGHLVFSGNYAGQSIESIIDDKDNLLRIYTENEGNVSRIKASIDRLLCSFPILGAGSMALSYMVNPLLGLGSFIAISGSWILHARRSCKKAIEAPAMSLSSGVHLIGEGVLFQVEKEYEIVQMSRYRQSQYNLLLEQGFDFSVDDFKFVNDIFDYYKSKGSPLLLFRDSALNKRFSPPEIAKLAGVIWP